MPGANLRSYNESWYLRSQKIPLSTNVSNPQRNYYYNKSIYVPNKFIVFLTGEIVQKAIEWMVTNSYVANIHSLDDEISSSDVSNIIAAAGSISDSSKVYDFSTVIRSIDFPHTTVTTSNDMYTSPISLHKEDLPVQLVTGGQITITLEENQEYYILPLLERMIKSYASSIDNNNSGKIGPSRYIKHINNEALYNSSTQFSTALTDSASNQIVPGIDIIVSNMIQPRSTTTLKNRAGYEVTADNGFGELVPLYAFTDMKPVAISAGKFDHSNASIKSWDLTLKGNIITDITARYAEYMEDIRSGTTRNTKEQSAPLYNGSLGQAVFKNMQNALRKYI